MACVLTTSLALILLLLASAEARPEALAVGGEEQAQWLRRVIPLPREVRFAGIRTLPASAVRVRLRDGAGEIEQHAAAKLESLL